MKTKQAVGSNKQTIIVKDLKTRKNPKGGALTFGREKLKGSNIAPGSGTGVGSPST